MRTRTRTRVSWTILSAFALLALAVPAAAGGEARVTIELTLRGAVPADADFYIGVGSSAASVCAGLAEQATWPAGSIAVPVCLSGRTYRETVTLAPGARTTYEVGISSPSRSRAIWSGTILGDGGDPVLAFIYRFGGAPETDAATQRPPGDPASPVPPLVLVFASMVGAGLWMRRQGGHAAGRRPSSEGDAHGPSAQAT